MIKYFLLVCCFVACQNSSRKKEFIKFSTEKLDTISAPVEKMVAKPLILEQAFMKGATQQVNGTTVNLYGITIGKLVVSTGRIIACDPMHIDEYGIPFTQNFPIGNFPVQLAIVRLGNEESVAFARINFNNVPVHSWQMAVLKDQKPLPVGGNKIHGFGVDGGVALYMDAGALPSFDQTKSANFDAEVFKQMNNHLHDGWRYTIYNFGKHNLAAFTTGFGDGRYATYIGLDASGKPCRLTTNFGLFAL